MSLTPGGSLVSAGRGRAVQLPGAASCGFSVNDAPTVVTQSGPQRLSYPRAELMGVRPVVAEADCEVLDTGLRSSPGLGQVLGGQVSYSFGDGASSRVRVK